MKKLLLCLLVVVPLILFSQKKDINKTTFEVKGVCEMCKVRIEKAAFKIKGVKTAVWDIPTHQFTILYDANKVKLEKVHEVIANAGHDTTLAKASREVYENLPLCCLYERKKGTQNRIKK